MTPPKNWEKKTDRKRKLKSKWLIEVWLTVTMVLACAAAISMTSFLVPFFLYLSPPPTPFPVSVSVCLPPHPIPTLCQVSTSFPQTCTVNMATSGLSRHSAAVAQCLCPYSLCSPSFLSLPVSLSFFLSFSLSFVWLVMSGLSNYVSIFSVVLIVFFFSFVSFWFVFIFSDVTFPLI